MVDLREKVPFLTCVTLLYGARSHMSGTVDSAGATPKAMAKRAVANETTEHSILDPWAMYKFCCEKLKQPRWASENKKPPLGTCACNGTYIWSYYDDELRIQPSEAPTSAPVVPFDTFGHKFPRLEGSSQLYYFRTHRPVDTPNADCKSIREIESRMLPCACTGCRADELAGIGDWCGICYIHFSKCVSRCPGPERRETNEDMTCVCRELVGDRQWSRNLQKTKIVGRQYMKQFVAKQRRTAAVMLNVPPPTTVDSDSPNTDSDTSYEGD